MEGKDHVEVDLGQRDFGFQTERVHSTMTTVPIQSGLSLPYRAQMLLDVGMRLQRFLEVGEEVACRQEQREGFLFDCVDQFSLIFFRVEEEV